MILDLARFVETERPYWKALEQILDLLERSPDRKLSFEEAQQFHALYQRAGSDLARISGFASEGDLRRHLEWLVSRAYSEIHESRGREKPKPWRWITREFPRAFRRHPRALALSLALTLAGAIFGGLALKFDPEAKAVLMPFEGLQISPAERVAREKQSQGKELAGRKGRFSAQLMTHNTQVALFALASGVTFGFLTIVLLFYNGVTLGAVALDYILGGQSAFLAGWLLPHGVIEIPAILIGGQAGLIVAHALIGWNSRVSRADRLRAVLPDVVMLAAGCAAMLVWAGIIEAFVSQYHEPVIRYEWKIAFGIAEAICLGLFLTRAGRRGEPAR
jgi:uncharacterized membrane protein SpoIIM required for sporulation